MKTFQELIAHMKTFHKLIENEAGQRLVNAFKDCVHEGLTLEEMNVILNNAEPGTQFTYEGKKE